MFVRIGQNQLLYNMCRTKKITVLIRYPKRYIQRNHERLENYLIIKEGTNWGHSGASADEGCKTRVPFSSLEMLFKCTLNSL